MQVVSNVACVRKITKAFLAKNALLAIIEVQDRMVVIVYRVNVMGTLPNAMLTLENVW